MNTFLQATAAVLLAVIMILILERQDKGFALLLTIGVSCIIVTVAGMYIEPVVDFLQQLQELGQLDNSFLEVLLKAVGIGFLAEIASLVCSDSGNGTLGKTLQMLASAVILWLSLPLLTSLIELVQEILGEV